MVLVPHEGEKVHFHPSPKTGSPNKPLSLMTAKPNNPLATHDIFKTVRKLYSNGSASFASKCHDFKYGTLNPLLSHIWLKSSLFSTNLSPLIYIVCVHYTHLLTTEDMLFQSQNEYWLKLFYEKVIPGSNLTSEYSLNTRMPFSCRVGWPLGCPVYRHVSRTLQA